MQLFSTELATTLGEGVGFYPLGTVTICSMPEVLWGGDVGQWWNGRRSLMGVGLVVWDAAHRRINAGLMN